MLASVELKAAYVQNDIWCWRWRSKVENGFLSKSEISINSKANMQSLTDHRIFPLRSLELPAEFRRYWWNPKHVIIKRVSHFLGGQNEE